MKPGDWAVAVGLALIALTIAIGHFRANLFEEPLIDHELDAGRAAQVRAWTGGEAEQSVRVCCPCSCGALAFCGGENR